VELYTAPPPGSTVICADELGPVIPRTFPPAPGWSPGGHRVKAPLEYSRGPEKTWVYGGLRVADGQAVTLCAPSRNSAFYQDFLALEEQANPEGTIWVITDNLSSHDSKSTRAWLEDHPPHPARLHPQARLLAPAPLQQETGGPLTAKWCYLTSRRCVPSATATGERRSPAVAERGMSKRHDARRGLRTAGAQ
jgi:DDE superfamily endonuclease